MPASALSLPATLPDASGSDFVPLMQGCACAFCGRGESGVFQADGTTASAAVDSVAANIATTGVLALGGSVNGSISPVADRDWYAVSLTAGQTYTFNLNGAAGALGALADPLLVLYNASGAYVSQNNDASNATANSQITFTAGTTGTYYLAASANGDADTGSYTLLASAGTTLPATTPLPSIASGLNIYNNGNPLALVAGQTINIYFATTGQTFDTQTASRDWTAFEIQQSMLALQEFSNVLNNVTFAQTTNQAEAHFRVVQNAQGSSLGTFYFPGNYAQAGIGWFRNNAASWTNDGLTRGGDAFATLVHEFGHGMGLGHPHDTGGGTTIMGGLPVGDPNIAFGNYGTGDLNQGIFSTMSYNSGWATGPNGAPPQTYGGAGGLMALDIAALQQVYGQNATYHNGNDTYALPTTNAVGTSYICIWDSGGTSDRIDASSSTLDAVIDLRAATLQQAEGGGGYVSYLAGIQGGFTIANGVVIENAIGGSGNDAITGNSGTNIINAGAGTNTILGGAGFDSFLYGGSGATTILDFIISDDNLALIPTWLATLITGPVTLSAILAYGAQVGANTVFTFSAGNTLTLNNVTMSALTNLNFGITPSIINGTAGDDPALIGTADADTINGFGGNDVLNGLGGADTMVGGDGNDSYVVDNTGDVITEAAGGATGYDVVTITAVTYTLGDNVEQGVATAGCTTITGSAQANYLYGGSSGLSLTLNGGDGDDVIYAGLAGGNTLSGGAGVDTLLIYGGNNTANGGTGSDIYYTYTTSDVLSEAGGDGIDTVFSNHDIVLGAGFEQLVLYGAATSATAGADNNIIYGNGATGGVTIDGGAGSDVIFGGANNDNLTGGAGVDLLFGQGGVNTLTGGDDTDIYYFAGGTDTVVETLTGGFDTIYSNNAGITVLAANVEQLILYGAATGGTGSAGNDYIYANAAAAGVTLDGADGADYLLGSANADILIGGLGNDQSDLSTGGADRIRYDVAGNMGMDIVYGFDANDASGGHDRIDLSGLGYNAGAIGGAITLTDGGGGNTIVSFVGAGPLVGTTINLTGVALANMGAGDFVF